MKSKPTSICCELYSQGFISEELYRKDVKTLKKLYSKRFIVNYCRAIRPLIWLMRRSVLASELTYRITCIVWLNRLERRQ